ncbi:MAG TPA: tetratricopeptide repeat protein [Stellaceae bacterium]|nr:tetratricopeptide repeat protein [Stellaceae bacterium]
MPDSTISPLLLRDTSRRTTEQGAGALRRTSPGTAAATGSLRANGSGHTAAVRPERFELRWRDIQWIDFSSEAESDTGRTAERPPPEPEALPLAMPEPAMVMVEPAKPPPPLGNLLRRFAMAAPATQTAKKSKPIPGLASRFSRMPVPRRVPDAIRLPLGRVGPVRLRPPPPATLPSDSAVVVVRRTLDPGKAAPAAPARKLVAVKTARSVTPFLPAKSAPVDRDRPFPASISTPVSVRPEPERPRPSDGWRLAVAAGAAAAGTIRQASATARAAGRSGFDRARAAIPQPRRGNPARREASVPRKPSAAAALLSGTVDRFSRFVAVRDNRLRLSGTAALAVVLVAVGAYIGGVVIARVAEPSAAPAPSQASRSAGPAQQQLTTADNASPPAPATPSAAPATPPAAAPAEQPPTDPAARAAFYITRAKAGDAVAQYDLGVLYAQGKGLVQDYTSAASWFRAAAAQGNVAAEYNLGVLYAQGLGVTANATEAINWYLSAADQHHPAAQFNLGLAYATGSGTKQDFAAAARWYKRAAAQGLPPAMLNLAILYEAGTGVERSLVDAYAWYSAAGERGDDAAKARAGELFRQFDDKDKARAEGLAATIGAALDSATGPPPPA